MSSSTSQNSLLNRAGIRGTRTRAVLQSKKSKHATGATTLANAIEMQRTQVDLLMGLDDSSSNEDEYEECLNKLILRLDIDHDKELDKEELQNMYPGLDASGIGMLLLIADENADNKLNKDELRKHLPDLKSIQDVLDIIDDEEKRIKNGVNKNPANYYDYETSEDFFKSDDEDEFSERSVKIPKNIRKGDQNIAKDKRLSVISSEPGTPKQSSFDREYLEHLKSKPTLTAQEESLLHSMENIKSAQAFEEHAQATSDSDMTMRTDEWLAFAQATDNCGTKNYDMSQTDIFQQPSLSAQEESLLHSMENTKSALAFEEEEQTTSDSDMRTDEWLSYTQTTVHGTKNYDTDFFAQVLDSEPLENATISEEFTDAEHEKRANFLEPPDDDESDDDEILALEKEMAVEQALENNHYTEIDSEHAQENSGYEEIDYGPNRNVFGFEENEQLSIHTDSDTSLPTDPDYLTGSEFNSDYSIVGSTLSLVSKRNRDEFEKESLNRLPQVQEKPQYEDEKTNRYPFAHDHESSMYDQDSSIVEPDERYSQYNKQTKQQREIQKQKQEEHEFRARMNALDKGRSTQSPHDRKEHEKLYAPHYYHLQNHPMMHEQFMRVSEQFPYHPYMMNPQIMYPHPAYFHSPSIAVTEPVNQTTETNSATTGESRSITNEIPHTKSKIIHLEQQQRNLKHYFSQYPPPPSSSVASHYHPFLPYRVASTPSENYPTTGVSENGSINTQSQFEESSRPASLYNYPMRYPAFRFDPFTGQPVEQNRPRQDSNVESRSRFDSRWEDDRHTREHAEDDLTSHGEQDQGSQSSQTTLTTNDPSPERTMSPHRGNHKNMRNSPISTKKPQFLNTNVNTHHKNEKSSVEYDLSAPPQSKQQFFTPPNLNKHIATNPNNDYRNDKLKMYEDHDSISTITSGDCENVIIEITGAGGSASPPNPGDEDIQKTFPVESEAGQKIETTKNPKISPKENLDLAGKIALTIINVNNNENKDDTIQKNKKYKTKNNYNDLNLENEDQEKLLNDNTKMNIMMDEKDSAAVEDLNKDEHDDDDESDDLFADYDNNNNNNKNNNPLFIDHMGMPDFDGEDEEKKKPPFWPSFSSVQEKRKKVNIMISYMVVFWGLMLFIMNHVGGSTEIHKWIAVEICSILMTISGVCSVIWFMTCYWDWDHFKNDFDTLPEAIVAAKQKAKLEEDIEAVIQAEEAEKEELRKAIRESKSKSRSLSLQMGYHSHSDSFQTQSRSPETHFSPHSMYQNQFSLSLNPIHERHLETAPSFGALDFDESGLHTYYHHPFQQMHMAGAGQHFYQHSAYPRNQENETIIPGTINSSEVIDTRHLAHQASTERLGQPTAITHVKKEKWESQSYEELPGLVNLGAPLKPVLKHDSLYAPFDNDRKYMGKFDESANHHSREVSEDYFHSRNGSLQIPSSFPSAPTTPATEKSVRFSISGYSDTMNNPRQ